MEAGTARDFKAKAKRYEEMLMRRAELRAEGVEVGVGDGRTRRPTATGANDLPVGWQEAIAEVRGSSSAGEGAAEAEAEAEAEAAPSPAPAAPAVILKQQHNDIFDPAFLAANQDVNYPKVIRPTVLTNRLKVKRDRDDHRPILTSDSDDEDGRGI